MKVCPHCSEVNSERARFCQGCGARLEEAAPAHEVRKTVTVLFCDVSGSTELARALEPESFRRLMARYFDEMRAVIEQHGGVVEKFIGDALMAVFGIPAVHEDDALRAVRAAAGMQERLAALNAELEQHWGVSVAARIGLATGEVVAGGGGRGPTLATGPPVALAARLEQAAGSGQVLLSRATHRLVRDTVRARQVGPLDLKGFGDESVAFSLTEVLEAPSGAARRMDTPLVGREDELRLLDGLLDEVVRRRAPAALTIVGEVGVGKSRLALEFLRAARARATVLSGRCPSYGEGSTSWPLAEVLYEAAGVAPGEPRPAARAKIAALLEGHADAALLSAKLAQAIGLTEGRAPLAEAFDAFVALFGWRARRAPLVLFFDDIHWAEPTFLDALRRVLERGHGPILVLCAARSELAERHPSWLGGELTGRSLTLRRLADEHCERLVRYVLGPEGGEAVSATLVHAAEGNPLFLEELLAMVIDEGLLVDHQGRYVLELDPGALRVPPSIQALLEARLDRLDVSARAVAEAAAVIGEWFEASELAALLAPEQAARLAEGLEALIDRELIEPEERPRGGASFRFHHALIREVTYEAMPKQLRAELHERRADWLEHNARGWSRRLQELLGHHLERAYDYRVQLGGAGDHALGLARRAGEQLGSAGHKALMRKDFPAAARLLARATELLPAGDPKRLDLLPLLGEALAESGQAARAYEVLDEALELGRAAGRRAVESHALMVLLKLPKRPGMTISLGLGLDGRVR